MLFFTNCGSSNFCVTIRKAGPPLLHNLEFHKVTTVIVQKCNKKGKNACLHGLVV